MKKTTEWKRKIWDPHTQHNEQDNFEMNITFFWLHLRDDIKNKDSPNGFVLADRTSNVYELKPKELNKWHKGNIVETYRIVAKVAENKIKFETKEKYLLRWPHKISS